MEFGRWAPAIVCGASIIVVSTSPNSISAWAIASIAILILCVRSGGNPFRNRKETKHVGTNH